MSVEYDAITAKHYAAYRPGLHKNILKKCFKNNLYFEKGIDIGCGTGQSALALSKFCNQVVGVDSSKPMLDFGIPNSKITYHHFNGKKLNFHSDLFDVATFAGSLFYAKSQNLLDETIRIVKNNGIILVYDFEILLGDILNKLKYESITSSAIYDHKTDFSGLQESTLSIVWAEQEKICIDVNPEDLAHLLLSVKSIHHFFKNKFEGCKIHKQLTVELKTQINTPVFNIAAQIYSKCYAVLK